MLASSDDRNGKPFLPAVYETNTKGASRANFEPADVEQFAMAHIDLSRLARERGTSAKVLRTQLGDRGIEPILPRPRLDRLVYRRSDL